MAYQTRKQLQLSVETLFRAADVLLKNGFPGQAAARAYYALYNATEYLAARHTDTLWPKDPRDTTRLSERFLHNAVAQVVFTVSRSRQTRGASKSDPYQLQAWAAELVTARMNADYRAYEAHSVAATQRRIVRATELTNIVLDEIDYATAQAKGVKP